MNFDTPAWLLLLPLALLPLRSTGGSAMPMAWLDGAPSDRPSQALHTALRVAAVLALAALVVGLAGPYQPGQQIERIGRGAEIVLVLDRSRSMDQGFGGARSAAPVAGTGPEALEYYSRLRNSEAQESKGRVARRLLSDFARQRPDDRFGMVVFSTLPMRVLGLTQKPAVIQAAINAGNIGRGLSETNIALALQEALGFFEGRPYTGSRIVLLVSDGGDRLDADARHNIREQARRLRVAFYWLYIRSPRSPGLLAEPAAALNNANAAVSANVAAAVSANVAAADDAVPEHLLHRYFESLELPYRAYEADNPDALQKAIADLNRLENLPIRYFDSVPRRDLSVWAHGTALAAVLLLLAASALELRRWR